MDTAPFERKLVKVKFIDINEKKVATTMMKICLKKKCQQNNFILKEILKVFHNTESTHTHTNNMLEPDPDL